jgi:beta-phosphoglucomutase-like phosphatase (HAD superfamily)
LPPRIKGVAFDAEGPLFEFEEQGHHLAHRMAAEEAGIKLTAKEAVKLIPNLCGGPGNLIAQQITDLIASRGIRPRLGAEEIQERSRFHFKRLFQEIVDGTRKIQPRPGLLGVIRELKEVGIPMMVGSSTPPEEFYVYFKATGLDKVFSPDQIVLVDEEKGIRHKPDPDIFLETAKRMGISPEEQLVIEDSLRGLNAGKAAGSPVMGMTVYDIPKAIIPLLEAKAFRVFSDWREVRVLGVITNYNDRQD